MSWISVNERIPNTYDDVLLWGKLSTVSWDSVVSGWIDDKGGWESTGYGPMYSVTHWMPLPKGPQETPETNAE